MATKKENIDSAANAKADKAAQKAHEKIEQVKPADDFVRRAANAAHEGVDRAADYATHAAESLTQKGERVKHKEEEWVEKVNQYVQQNPVTALGIAVAGGFLISRIFSNR